MLRIYWEQQHFCCWPTKSIISKYAHTPCAVINRLVSGEDGLVFVISQIEKDLVTSAASSPVTNDGFFPSIELLIDRHAQYSLSASKDTAPGVRSGNTIKSVAGKSDDHLLWLQINHWFCVTGLSLRGRLFISSSSRSSSQCGPSSVFLICSWVTAQQHNTVCVFCRLANLIYKP